MTRATPRLSVNVDHVATLRQARRAAYPDPVEAAVLAEAAGAAGITAHLRADRRHIQDHDVTGLRERVRGKLNLELAPTEEMLALAARFRPDQVSLVPERPEEVTTEGGLDVIAHGERVLLAAAAPDRSRNRRLGLPRPRPPADRRPGRPGRPRRTGAGPHRRLRDQHRRLHPSTGSAAPCRASQGSHGRPPRRRPRLRSLRRPRPHPRQRRPRRRPPRSRGAEHRPRPHLPRRDGRHSRRGRRIPRSDGPRLTPSLAPPRETCSS